ncbi:MAG: hypothetical protein NTY90_03780 [Candidatus Micrarchaeota archaeon]|nr:hypothetical protein [Candidatus Micrarchaeota archaeon]
MDALVAAKYPFTSFAKKYLQAAGVEKIDSNALEEAKSRVIAAVREGGRGAGGARGTSEATRAGLVSYALARIMLAYIGKSGVSRKFALREARAAAERLEAEDEELFISVARDFFPSAAAAAGEYSVSLPDFLKYGSGLIHAGVEAGKVFMDRGDLTGVLREAITAKVMDLPKVRASEVPALVREAAEELEEELPKESFTGFAGKHLALSCVKKILSGMEEGRRYYGSMALAIACIRDGLAREEAKKVMEQYAGNCRRATHPFTAREALATLDWVYKHPAIRFSCRTMRENGLIGEYCESCPYRFKKRGG